MLMANSVKTALLHALRGIIKKRSAEEVESMFTMVVPVGMSVSEILCEATHTRKSIPGK